MGANLNRPGLKKKTPFVGCVPELCAFSEMLRRTWPQACVMGTRGTSRAAGLQGVSWPACEKFLLNAIPQGWSFPCRPSFFLISTVILSSHESLSLFQRHCLGVQANRSRLGGLVTVVVFPCRSIFFFLI